MMPISLTYKNNKTMKQSLDQDQLIELARKILKIKKQISEICQFLELPMDENQPLKVEYPAMSKSEFAKIAGYNQRSFRRALRPHQAKLEELGSPRSSKILTSKAVEFLCKLIVIDISKLQKNN